MAPFPGSSETAVLPRVHFAGMPIDPLSVEQAVETLALRPATAAFGVYVTPNVEFIYLSRRRPEMKAALDASWLCTNDSRILHRLASWAGVELNLAPGAHVVDRLFHTVIEADDPMSIIGGSEAIAEDLRRLFGLRRLVRHTPPMGFIRNPAAVQEAVDFVAAHPSRFVMVAMGPPQSEILCRRIALDGRCTGIGLCIGSSLQALTGQIGRAPDWMERSGLVWLHRLAREPGRLWRRYLLHDAIGLAICLHEVLGRRRAERRALA